MPFLLPALPAIIGAGGSIVSSLIGGGKQKNATPQPPPMDPRFSATIDRLLSGENPGEADYTAGSKTLASADQALQSTNQGLGKAKDYYTRILGGDRESIANVLAPEVSTVLDQYDTGAKAASEFASRGGGRNRIMAELPTLKAGVYGKALQGARPAAATGITGIAGQEGVLANARAGIGRSQAAIGTDRSQDARARLSQALTSLLGEQNLKQGGTFEAARFQNEEANRARKEAQGIGGSIADILGKFIPGGRTSKSKIGGPGVLDGLSGDLSTLEE